MLELLLVLAIVLVVAGAATPAVVSLMAEQRLKQGVEKVRAALAATRIEAIDHSATYQFRFEPGGRRFLAIPIDQDGLGDQSDVASLRRTQRGELPDDCTFQPPTTSNAVSTTSMIAASASEGDVGWNVAIGQTPAVADLSSVIWSPPVTFRADGTASDSAFDVVASNGNGVRFYVRRLTGETITEPVQSGSR